MNGESSPRDIGSAKPTVRSCTVRHRPVDHQIDPAEAFLAKISQTLGKGRHQPGRHRGTGLYLAPLRLQRAAGGKKREIVVWAKREFGPRVFPNQKPVRFERCRKNSSQQHQSRLRFKEAAEEGAKVKIFRKIGGTPGIRLRL